MTIRTPNYFLFILADMFLEWFKCKKKITKLNRQNRFAKHISSAFAAREDMLLTNPTLAAAIYLDPRIQNLTTDEGVLASLKRDAEVVFLRNYIQFLVLN
jgi:hypothetical protein